MRSTTLCILLGTTANAQACDTCPARPLPDGDRDERSDRPACVWHHCAMRRGGVWNLLPGWGVITLRDITHHFHSVTLYPAQACATCPAGASSHCVLHDIHDTAFHSIPFHSILSHSIVFHSIPFALSPAQACGTCPAGPTDGSRSKTRARSTSSRARVGGVCHGDGKTTSS